MRWVSALMALVLAGVLVSSGVKAAEPYGAIGEKYAALGGRGGALGPAIGNESDAPYGGRFHLFKEGVIYWHPEVGAYAVWGAISVKYWQLGRAEYGYPITDESVTPDGRGRYNHFRAMHAPGRPESSIYWTPETGAHAVYGAIRDAWARGGWERGELGYPTSDEFDTGGGRRQDFERGYIAWTPQGGARIVRSGSGLPTPPQTFGSHLVRGMEIAVAGRRVAGDANFLSENAICGAFNAARPSLEEAARSELFASVAPQMHPFGLHPDGTKVHLSPACSFRAEVAQACSSGPIRLRIVLPRNILRFQVTTPSLVGGVGFGEYADPKLSVDFDVAAETSIILPRDRNGSIRLDTTRVTISNVRPGSQSPTGDLALAAAKVYDYVSGRGLFAQLAQTRIFRLPGLEQSLGDLNPAVAMIPPAYRIDSCVGASDVLTLNGTNAPEDRGPIVN